MACWFSNNRPACSKHALLARGVDVDQHVAGGQDGSKTIHGIAVDREFRARPKWTMR
jgi:hypothetical protein